MELVAYTFSDVILVTRILSQIAMIFDGGAFDVAAKLAAVIGLIVALFVSVFRGGQFSMATFFWPIMVAILMILPRVDLVIEDKNGGLARVDDLPIGFAAPISIITTIGAGLSDMLTENLGLEDTAITMDNGHLLALRAPLVYQQIITDDQFHGEAATFANGLSPVKDTMIYVERCLKSQDKLPALETKYSRIKARDFSTFRVTGYFMTVGGSNGRTYECEELYDALMAGFESSEYQASLNSAVNEFFSKYQNDTTTGLRYQAALESVVSDLPRFYAGVAWANAVQRAPAHFVGAAGGGSHQAALDDALNQRREKNYGTAAIIFETMATTISFIEIWSLSIMPIVLLLMMIGPLGGKTAAKYFWMLVWVQFWYPTLLIVMGFLDASLDAMGIMAFINISSVHAFLTEVTRLQDVGYLYLSLATALSMFLVFGTSSALATSMQRDMSGGDHYDPKKNAPDTIKRDPVNVFSSAFQYSPMSQGTAIATDANKLGDVMVSLGHGVTSDFTAAQVAAFAGSGSLGTSTAYSKSQGTTNLSSATNSQVATQSVAVANGTTLTFGAGVNAGSSVGGERSAGVTSAAGTNKSLYGGAYIGGAASGGIGGGGEGGSIPGASITGGARAGVTGEMKWSNDYRESDSNKLSYDMGSVVKTDQTGRVDGSLSLGESDTKSTVNTSGLNQSNQKVEGAVESQQATWTNNESESQSRQEMVFQRASQQFKLSEISSLMANNPNAMHMTKQAVYDARLNQDVERFMDQNERQLNQLFSGRNADEARYAFAAHYVMQGMDGLLYAEDTKNGQERRDAINAVSDDIMRFAGLGTARGREAGPELSNLQSFERVDPEELRDAYMGASQGYRMDGEIVRNALKDLDPTIGKPSEVLKEMQKLLGVPFADMPKSHINGVLESVSSRIEEQHGPIDKNKLDFAETLKERGFASAFYSTLVGSVPSVLRDAFDSKYEEIAYAAGARYADVTTGDAEAVAQKAETMLDKYLEKEVEAGTIGGNTDVAKYMSLSALRGGADNVGDHTLAARFSQMMGQMEEADPILKNPETSSKLQALGAMGFTNREYMRGVAEYQLGGIVQQLSNDTGHEGLNAAGIGVQWSKNPDRVGRGTLEGGGTTLPAGTREDLILSFVGSLEAPKGYDDFERASSRNPPPQPLTEMTIGEVMQWQDGRIRGVETRAAGRYQMTGGSDPNGTFVKAVRGAGLSESDRFTPETQDRLGVYLLNARGLNSLSENGNVDGYAHSLSQEWAILPRMTGPNPEASYYDKIQGNRAGVSPDRVRALLEKAAAAPSAQG